jgi:two-component system cell cycle sensor histidine kinase/response regulator CckA
MSDPLRILHLEDNPQDAELIQAALKADGITCEVARVESKSDFIAALDAGNVDLVLSDFSLPNFDGLSAIELAQERCPDIPVILVSGTLGEELAIDSLKKGATDYVLKERLSRLGPAVRRAMKEVHTTSEHRQLEAQFIQSQKMEVLGQLAGGVAHDFNNILAIIWGCSESILKGLSTQDPLRGDAEEILHATERAITLTRQLLVFSRSQTSQPIILDLNEILENMDKMLRRLINESIEMTVVPGRSLGRIKADPGQIGQVLMNLVVNARDAMPNGGRLTIETKNVSLSENEAKAAGLGPGPYVALMIRDTGVGITDKVKDRLFEAFFTTKPKGKGTGLGLATCQTISRECGGHIGFTSEVGKGTIFTVYFPEVNQPLTMVTRPQLNVDLPRGTETLLLVEDDPGVRHLAARVLEKQGYTVLRASNGQDGLNIVREHQGPTIALVITDVIMPQMGGKVMVEWLKSLYPHLKVLFTSGYTEDAIAHHGVLDEGVSFLPKPYSLTTLTHTVRNVLDGKKSELEKGVVR